MATRLRFNSGQVPWSLVAKAIFLAAVWLLLPGILFFAAALYFYFFPLFRPFTFAAPFALSLLAAALLPPSGGAALLVGFLFFLVFGIKEFVFVDRVTAYELLAFILLLVLSFAFFGAYQGLGAARGVVWGMLLVAAAYLLLRRFLRLRGGEERTPSELALSLVAAVLLLEFLYALLLLSIRPFGQAALFTMGALLFFELAGGYVRNELPRKRIAATLGAFALLLFIVWTSTAWTLE
jgi:hypothetical protein